MSTPELPPDVPDENPHYIAAVTKLGDERHVVAKEDVYSSNGVKLVAQGTRVNDELVERLTRHKLKIPLDRSLEVDQQLTAALLAVEVGKVIEREPLLARLTARTGDSLALKHGISSLDLPKPVAFRLTVMQAINPALFQHSICCALLAHSLALGMHLPADSTAALLIAALCHDFGEMHTDPALLASGRRVLPQERCFIHVHPITGFILLRNLGDEVSRDCMTAVLQHHERLDGSGYPYGLRGERIAPLSRILAIADVAEVMLRRFQPQRVDVMLRLNQSRLDPEAVGLLRDLLRPEFKASVTMRPEGNLEKQFLHVVAALESWESSRDFFEQVILPGTEESVAFEFLRVRMREIRSLLLQSGIDIDDFGTSLQLAQDDVDVHAEIQASLDELCCRLTDIANEIERRAPPLGDLAQVTMDNLVQTLRESAVAERSTVS